MNHSRNPHIARDVITGQRIIIKAAWLHQTDKRKSNVQEDPWLTGWENWRCSQRVWKGAQLTVKPELNCLSTTPSSPADSCYIKAPACSGANETFDRLKLNSLCRQDRKRLEKGKLFRFFHDTYWKSNSHSVRSLRVSVCLKSTTPKTQM